MKQSFRRQRGSTLIVALIILVLLTLFATSSFNTAKTNLAVVGNMQASAEATNVAQQAVETVISTTQFITTPANAVLNSCGAANTLCTDVNGDGVNDYTTLLTPQPGCIKVQVIKNTELNLANTEDQGCSKGVDQMNFGMGVIGGDSLCSYTVWEVTAKTTGAATGASATIVQGVGIRVSNDDASC